MMQILITYDVSTIDKAGQRRLRYVAKTCLDYGQRVQNSVFECLVDYAHFVELKSKLLQIINTSSDSIRFYNLGTRWDRHVEHHGIKPSLNFEAPLIL